MSYIRKTKDVWCIDTNYGYGWEEEDRCETKKEACANLKGYQEHMAHYGGMCRLKKRREKIA